MEAIATYLIHIHPSFYPSIHRSIQSNPHIHNASSESSQFFVFEKPIINSIIIPSLAMHDHARRAHVANPNPEIAMPSQSHPNPIPLPIPHPWYVSIYHEEPMLQSSISMHQIICEGNASPNSWGLISHHLDFICQGCMAWPNRYFEDDGRSHQVHFEGAMGDPFPCLQCW